MGRRLQAFWKKHKILCTLACAAPVLAVLLAVALAVLHPHGTNAYLVLGMDNYGSLNDIGRSDMMLLAQVDFDAEKVSAVTFARDMMIPGGFGKDVKINTIVRMHDEQTLVSAIENAFGVRIDGWFRVNFTSVIEMVDALGGVEVELTQEEADYINEYAGDYPDNPLREGTCRLCGGQALVYARCRKLDNDFGRGARQLKLVEALVKRTKQLSVGQLRGVYDSLDGAWRSSLGAAEQLGLFARALWLRGAQVERIGVPFEGTYRYGDACVLADIEQNRAMLQAALGLAPAPGGSEAP